MATSARRVERALLSVSDKTGIVELAQALRARNVEILSTGGTAEHLRAAGVDVTPIAAWAGAPEMLGGRVKTLTPKVFGAILHDRMNASHTADVERFGIPPIDVVVVNLYPFEKTITRKGVTVAEAIEQIDIGGPSMLRAAAKNHRFVVPLSDPSQYEEFLRELEKEEISDDFRERCAVAVFEKTAAYDAAIAEFLGKRRPATGDLQLELQRFQDLRYGENPHQSASFYALPGTKPFEQLHGKELSYNNLLDVDAARRLSHAFTEPAACVIKHTNPCGVAQRSSIEAALKAAIDADSVSAFGGIIGVNRPFDEACAAVVDAIFLEVIVARSFTEEALVQLRKKKNLRLIVAATPRSDRELRTAAGGILAQDIDRISGRQAWTTVTERKVTDADLDELEFAWIVSAHVKSNAIVLTRGRQSIGIGAGQMSRVDAAKLAIMKATASTAGAFAASDAFFPFRDGIDILADAGVRIIVQPGGSVRDAEVIAAANARGVAMVLTHERHFRH